MSYSLYVVRHGEARLNHDNIVMGTIDSLLTEKGVEQAQLLRAKLSDVQFDKVYASPLKRAIETASIIVGNNDIEIDNRLLERTFGDLEGRPVEALNRARERAHSSGIEPWRQKLSPNTESDSEIYTRVKDFIDENSKDWDGKTILLGTHSGPARALLIGLGFFSEEALPPGAFQNGNCAVIINSDEKFILKEVMTN